jgi:hypothetical protein
MAQASEFSRFLMQEFLSRCVHVPTLNTCSLCIYRLGSVMHNALYCVRFRCGCEIREVSHVRW